MTIELWVVVWSAVLLFVLISLNAGSNMLSNGVDWARGNRDAVPEKSPPWIARVGRAYTNLQENLLIFAIVVVAAHLADIHNDATVTGAQLFFIGRIIHALSYGFGTNFLFIRTIGYYLGVFGTAYILIQLF